jgi:Holliday junction DNA helicase RuvA
MITRLTGVLEQVEGNTGTLAPTGGGIAYEVLVPTYLAAKLSGRVGQSVTVLTLQYLEGQNQGSSFIPRLIAFASDKDRDFFELFTTVKGIGNRKALRALAVEPAAVARAVAARDVKALTQLPEIGKRMAETIIAELSGKVEAYLSVEELGELEVKSGGALPALTIGDVASEEAVLALMALGETRADAEEMVLRAAAKLARVKGGTAPSTEAILDAVFAGRGR